MYMPLSLLWVPLFFTNASKAFFSLHSWNIERIKRKILSDDDINRKCSELKLVSIMNNPMNDVPASLAVAGIGKVIKPEKNDSPSLILRISIIKRMTYIITKDVVGRNYGLDIKGNNLTVTYFGLKEVIDKWMIPRKAKDAFERFLLKLYCTQDQKTFRPKELIVSLH